MTNEEAKKEFFKRGRVLYKGHPYWLKNIVYGFDQKGKFIVSAVLDETNGCSSQSTVLIKDIEKEYIENENQDSSDKSEKGYSESGIYEHGISQETGAEIRSDSV